MTAPARHKKKTYANINIRNIVQASYYRDLAIGPNVF
jgi:hypothetical protein